MSTWSRTGKSKSYTRRHRVDSTRLRAGKTTGCRSCGAVKGCARVVIGGHHDAIQIEICRACWRALSSSYDIATSSSIDVVDEHVDVDVDGET